MIAHELHLCHTDVTKFRESRDYALLIYYA